MADFIPTGHLASWSGDAPDIRDWSDADILDGLRQLGIETDREKFSALAQAAKMQGDLEEDWLIQSGTADQGLQVFVWMSVQELWERWLIPAWPKDRTARMFLYLVDADFSTQLADMYHVPSAIQVFDGLEIYLQKDGRGRAAVDELIMMGELPAEAWPGKMLDAMAEWTEIGSHSLTLRGGAFMAQWLGHGDARAFAAAAYVSARMYDRAQVAAMEVPMDAPLDASFAEMVGYLCLSNGDALLGNHWILHADSLSKLRKSEMTFAAEAVRDFLATYRELGDDGVPVPQPILAAAKQGAAQAAYYAFMAFAGNQKPGGGV